MNAIETITTDQEQSVSKVKIGRHAYTLIKQAAHLFETKFPLVTTVRLRTKMQINEILTDDFGVYNILYLPFDEKRIDKEEQVKISNDKQKITVVIKNDLENPEISFQLFELNDGQTERKIEEEKNTTRSIFEVNKMLGELSRLSDFDLVYQTSNH